MGNDVETIDLIKCIDSIPGGLSLQVTSGGVGFQTFFRQFQTTMDVILEGKNPALTNCRLTNAPSSSSLPSNSTTAIAFPTLVKLVRSPTEFACIPTVQSLLGQSYSWASSLRLLSRSNGKDLGSTVALVHINQTQADAIGALDCVFRVTILSPLMKLAPLARSLPSVVADLSPPLEIEFIDGMVSPSASEEVHRMNAALKTVTGLVDLLVLQPSGAIYMPPLANFDTWVAAMTWICHEPMVMFVTQHATLQIQAMPVDASWFNHRRLDADTSSVVGAQEAQQKGILGNGIVVGITDSGLYMDHDQFDQTSPREFNRVNLDARKVVLYQVIGDQVDQSETVTCGHGTHVSGILAGSSLSKSAADVGLAPNAKIAFTDIGTQDVRCANQAKCPVNLITPGNVQALLGPQLSAGARIFSFSWGLPGDDYSRQARDFDDFIAKNPETLLIIAAGNSGDNGTKTITSPAGAKNVITVGASLTSADALEGVFGCPSAFNPQSVASFSSMGPTKDGRLKPDFVAPGQILSSAQSEAAKSTVKSSKLCPLQGTSQATPVAAGLAVLIYEWLRDGWWRAGVLDKANGMTSVPAALIKALLIHSSSSLTRRLRNIKGLITCKSVTQDAIQLKRYPDESQGYGLPDLSKLVYFGQNAKVYFLPNTTVNDSPALMHQGVHIYSFNVRPQETLRVTLVRGLIVKSQLMPLSQVWNDPAGSVLGGKLLQNDLDLSITLPGSSKVFYPLSGGGTAVDTMNNVEMVEVSYDALASFASNATSTVRVEVRIAGTSVMVNAPQTYAFVASSGLNSASEIPGVPLPSTNSNGGMPARASLAPVATSRDDFEWQPWMTITLASVGGVLVVALVVVLCVRRRGTTTTASTLAHPHYVQPVRTPVMRLQCANQLPPPTIRRVPVPMRSIPPTTPQGADMCPFCSFFTNDPVTLVNHVQAFHQPGGSVRR
ncbi:Aste57867_328 [Aphanomyces stellatus]|uniref:subtilisin n=1 Tax=Aphanomyces stellatus TaxID=120398 RepID=A0A485K3C7_9STRA|nr:hypothetical protein As57867_000328 [Aphanomyces stellatus]VFT77554.1 Aste57867_328 [Aphanomyces stellatus]